MKIRNLDSKKIWDYENGFYWFSSQSRINKLLSHYELYKKIINIPGHIFEFGVYKAASLIRLASFRSSLENDLSRKIIGFDAYGKFPQDKLTFKEDIAFINKFESEGGDGLNDEEINEILKNKNFTNIELIKGNVFETLPDYLKKNPEVRISFLHLDMDVEEPTKLVLDLLYERVVPNGLIVFDDYNAVAGETNIADKFIKKNQLRIDKLPFSSVPSFVIKK